MAAYLSMIASDDLTVADVLKFADELKRRKVDRHLPVHIGLTNKVVIAVPIKATLSVLPSMVAPEVKPVMRGAKRAKRKSAEPTS